MTTINLPVLHVGQIEAWKARTRFQALVCGRRFGKSAYISILACDAACKGQSVGIFAPAHKTISELYLEIIEILHPLVKSASRNEGIIRLTNGGKIDTWSLENDLAGRGRKYHLVLIDECAFGNDKLLHNYKTAIAPTIIDYKGSVVIASTPNGCSPDNFFYEACTNPKLGFTVYHAPTSSNPLLPVSEIERIKATTDPLIYQQEYEAKFINFSGVVLFNIENCLENGLPVPTPRSCDSIFAVIDSAVRDGAEHDSTAVIYLSYSKHPTPKLVILDYDAVKVNGDVLPDWLPNVYIRLNELAQTTKPRYGISGVWIEERNTGITLLQHCKRHNLQAQGIDMKLMQLGKDARAINATGFLYQKLIKLSEYAYNKTININGKEENHLLSQTFSFRIGDKTAARRADDLLDCFVYAILIAFGDNKGM